ncbi:MAG: hypothetical protein M0C28_37100 [Candidatus Moduliflexus flocculans]|nr:hypothetical protein [Candidatus Moduliflexus flocculans]
MAHVTSGCRASARQVPTADDALLLAGELLEKSRSVAGGSLSALPADRSTVPANGDMAAARLAAADGSLGPPMPRLLAAARLRGSRSGGSAGRPARCQGPHQALPRPERGSRLWPGSASGRIPAIPGWSST